MCENMKNESSCSALSIKRVLYNDNINDYGDGDDSS